MGNFILYTLSQFKNYRTKGRNRQIQAHIGKVFNSFLATDRTTRQKM